MIPNGSTPIKNEILTEIFAKGLLSKEEMRIIFYIIRWSWGFVGKDRRQDWTKPLKQSKIADDIGMARGNLNRELKNMIAENKIIEKDNCYQFNEHYEKWKVIKLIIDKNEKKVIKKIIADYQIDNRKLSNKQSKVIKLITSTDLKANGGNGLPDRKETLKETIKETIKEKGDVFLKALKDFKSMRNKIKKPITPRSEKMIYNKLEKLANDESTQIKILEQSILHCWQDVYPLKQENMSFEEKVLLDNR